MWGSSGTGWDYGARADFLPEPTVTVLASQPQSQFAPWLRTTTMGISALSKSIALQGAHLMYQARVARKASLHCAMRREPLGATTVLCLCA